MGDLNDKAIAISRFVLNSSLLDSRIQAALQSEEGMAALEPPKTILATRKKSRGGP
jgi:hypothetical protein